VAVVTQSVAYGAFFTFIVLIPLFLQTNLNYRHLGRPRHGLGGRAGGGAAHRRRGWWQESIPAR
jgi:hypothetical protein